MRSGRDRSTGWSYAKATGHKNEELIAILLGSNYLYRDTFLRRAGYNSDNTAVNFGGLRESSIDSVLGGKTKSKSDIWILGSDGSSVCGISIKKSPSGQVFLIKLDRFIQGLEVQYDMVIPDRIKRILELLWGSDKDRQDITNKYCKSIFRDYENRKNRLVGDTLMAYDSIAYDCIIEWFSSNVGIIADFCFSKGLSKYNHADIVWYKNIVDSEVCMDELFSVADIVKGSIKNRDMVFFGDKGGGTTIQLPFGFVQWHQESLQFHHNLEKIRMICKSR